MYSVVLMVAMTSGVELPDCHRGRKRGGGHGCGCAPVVYSPPVASCGCVGTMVTPGGGAGGGGGGGTESSAPITAAEQKEWDAYIEGLDNDTDKADAKKAWDEADNAGKRELLKQTRGGEVKGPAPARLVVKLPARARLTIGGAATTSTAAQRTFLSPTLQPGRNYYYTLQATYIQDGKPVVVKRIVAVRAGQLTAVSLNAPRTTAVTAQR